MIIVSRKEANKIAMALKAPVKYRNNTKAAAIYKFELALLGYKTSFHISKYMIQK